MSIMNQIFVEAKKLICKDGKVWAWKSDNIEAVNFFATKEDAQKYIELRRQWRQEKDMEAESYSIGTEADYMAAAKKYEADKKANEVKEFCKHADALIERRKLEIKALISHCPLTGATASTAIQASSRKSVRGHGSGILATDWRLTRPLLL